MRTLIALFCASLAVTAPAAKIRREVHEPARTASVASVTAALGAALSNYPASFSLRPAYMKFGIDVRNQGRRGSCLIFGTLDPLEFYLSLHGKTTHLSERFSMWAANEFRGKTAKSSDYTVADVIGSIKEYGYVTLDADNRRKYRDSGGVGSPDKEAIAAAATNRDIIVQYFGAASGISAADIQAMCSALMASNPVTLCMNWADPISFSSSKIIKPWKVDKGGHAVVAVGFVVDKHKPGGGMFEIRNSWGDNWGKDGYAFITFDLFVEKSLCAFTITPGAP